MIEKPLIILEKRVVFSIWRAEKWKFIAGDWIKRFSLIVRNFSIQKHKKRFSTILKNFGKYFYFFGWRFWKFSKKSRNFRFRSFEMTLDFCFEIENFRDFSEIFKISIQKMKMLFSIFSKFLKIVFYIFGWESCARSARISLSNLPRWISTSLPAI